MRVSSDTIEESRKRILDAARQLLRKYGYDKMTVVDIARSLGMSHANVYRFFKNKSDIVDAITPCCCSIDARRDSQFHVFDEAQIVNYFKWSAMNV